MSPRSKPWSGGEGEGRVVSRTSILLSFACFLFFVANVQAAKIVAFQGQVTGDNTVTAPVLVTKAEGSDNVVGFSGSNKIRGIPNFHDLSPIDMVFTVDSANEAASEYWFLMFVGNLDSAGRELNSITVSLGFYDVSKQFFAALPTSNLDFDFPDPDFAADGSAGGLAGTPTYLMNVLRQAEMLRASGGLIPNGRIESLSFMVDIPSVSTIPTSAFGYNFNTLTHTGTYQFVMRVQAGVRVAVPEPAAGVAAIALVLGIVSQIRLSGFQATRSRRGR
jgi:hypothetical protein